MPCAKAPQSHAFVPACLIPLAPFIEVITHIRDHNWISIAPGLILLPSRNSPSGAIAMTTATMQSLYVPFEQAKKIPAKLAAIFAVLFMVDFREAQSDESCAYAAYLA
jgi:hypothetical protein